MHFDGKNEEEAQRLQDLWSEWGMTYREENWNLVWAMMDSAVNEVEHLKIWHFPTILLFPGKDKEMWYQYEGEFSYEAILKWAEPLLSYRPINTEL